MLLMDMGEILRLVCWYPSAAVLLQTIFGNHLQSVRVPPQGNTHPCTALVILDNPPDLAVDAIDFTEISWNFLYAFRNTIDFPL